MILEKKQITGFNVLSCGKYKDVCLYGSGRSGKTFLVCYFIIRRAMQYPGSYHLFIRSTYTSLLAGVFSQTIPAVLKALKKSPGVDLIGNGEIRLRHNPAEIVFYNGSSIRFLGLDTQISNAAATDKILSQEYLTACFEEASEIDYKVVEKVKTRLAQKIEGVRPMSIYTLNPTTFDSWDYIYFSDHINPISKEPVSNPNELYLMHFSVYDNLKNISKDFVENLKNLSPIQRRRFLDGIYGDNFDGEIFQVIYWEELPNIGEFDRIIVYNDPSYKSGPKNDYKATGAIGVRNGAFWLIWCEAMQCTTSQMIINNYLIAQRLYNLGWQQTVEHWFENAGMPDDFIDAVQKHADVTGWVCPYRLDGRQKGDKFARIESALVPLNEQGKLFFNKAMKGERIGSLIAQQFGNFKAKLLPTEHDDIPDMVHGGVTLLNQPTFEPGQTRILMRKPKFTL